MGCSVPDECPEEIASLIKDCLSADPDGRPSSTEAFLVLQQQASRAGPSPRGSTDVSMHARHVAQWLLGSDVPPPLFSPK